MKVPIRLGTTDDAVALSAFGARVFSETFAAANRPEDMALYLEKTFSPSMQAAELADANITTLLAEVDGSLAGYAQLRQGKMPAEVTGESPIELWRLYVAGNWHGRGVATELMNALEQRARHLGARTLWLGVWEKNERAKSFYRRYGFIDVGSHLFMLGNDEQVDRIWVRLLAGSDT